MKILLSGSFPDGKFPSRAHDDDAGIDLLALESVVVKPGECVRVQTSAVGLAAFAASIYEEMDVHTPEQLVIAGFVWDKSGLANRGITVLGGVIDQSYTDQIGVVLYNTNVRAAFERTLIGNLGGLTKDAIVIQIMESWDRGSVSFGPGDKVAQLIIQDVWVPSPEHGTLEMIRAAIREGARGDKGFGSSGV